MLDIYVGKSDKEGLFPFATLKLPQYLNRPAYSKFRNFLQGNVVGYEDRLTCDIDIGALEATESSLSINTDRCIACLSCICSRRNPFVILSKNILHVLSNIIPDFDILRQKLVKLDILDGELFFTPTKQSLTLKIKDFVDYTAKKELEHIALWATIMLKFLASDDEARVGKEIQLANPISPRDNRLDTCCVSKDIILVGETKTDLDSLLQENRYRVQIPSYQKVCEKLVSEHNRLYGENKEVLVVLVIGGRETDLLPSTHPWCTSVVGGKSLRFYNDIINHNIKFISSNLIWLMALYSLVVGKRLCWDILLPSIFSNQHMLGILSCGQVVQSGSQIRVENVSPKALDLAVQDFS